MGFASCHTYAALTGACRREWLVSVCVGCDNLDLLASPFGQFPFQVHALQFHELQAVCHIWALIMPVAVDGVNMISHRPHFHRPHHRHYLRHHPRHSPHPPLSPALTIAHHPHHPHYRIPTCAILLTCSKSFASINTLDTQHLSTNSLACSA